MQHKTFCCDSAVCCEWDSTLALTTASIVSRSDNYMQPTHRFISSVIDKQACHIIACSQDSCLLV